MSRLLRIAQWVLIGAAILVIPQLFTPVGLDFNRSKSLPRGLYWHENSPVQLTRGDWACFEYVAPEWAAPRHYFPTGAQLCKVVMGLPGDRIFNRDNEIFLCPQGAPCADAGHLLSADGRGRPAQAAQLPGTIPPGQLYMGSTRVSNSFDSRYLGLIDESRITRRIHPLLTER